LENYSGLLINYNIDNTVCNNIQIQLITKKLFDKI